MVISFTREPNNQLVVIHGPNPATQLTTISEDNLQARVQKWFETKNNKIPTPKTPVIPIVIPPVIPVPISSPPASTTQNISIVNPVTSVATVIPVTNTLANNLGIAAGGALIYLGQPELDIYFKNLSDLGLTWLRWDIAWNVVQPTNANQYNWDAADRVVATAKKYNIKMLGIITYAPAWSSTPNACNSAGMCVPTDPATFGTFAGTVALRYKGSVDHFEIWNEPNYSFFWKPKPNTTTYISILQSSYTEIKRVNPDATVIAGALASSGDEVDGSISPITFVRALYAGNAKVYFDAISVHPYTYPAAPDYVASWNSWQQVTTIHQIMIDNGDLSKKIWITEYGTPTGGPGTAHDINQLSFTYGADYMTEMAQQQAAQKVVELYQKDKAFFGPLFWYSLKDDGISNTTPENFFGLIRFDGTKKPAYDIFRNIVISARAL